MASCEHINSSLSREADVSQSRVLRCNTNPQRCFQGIIAGYEGFVLTPAEAGSMVRQDGSSASCIYPFLIGRDLLTGTGKPTRFVIDMTGYDLLQAQSYRNAFAHLKENVLPYVQQKARPGASHDEGRRGHLEKWWEMWRPRPEMVRVLSRLSRYIACSDTTKRPIFEFIHPSIRPDHKIRVFAFDDDYSQGMLQSHAHWIWFITKCSKLKSDFNYTSSNVFDPFPWPQSPTVAQIDAVAEAGREVRRVRADALTKIKGGLRAVYRTLEPPGKNPLKDAHAALDAAVLSAYGFSPKDDLLSQLLALNLEVARRESAGEPVTAPGIPPGHSEPARLVTDDCIRSASEPNATDEALAQRQREQAPPETPSRPAS
jgi:hypothetical protein